MKCWPRFAVVEESHRKMSRRTYVDANVLIAAFQGDRPTSAAAIAVLDDPQRTLVISDYLRLETLPKPTFHNREEEVEFFEAVLDAAGEMVHSNDGLTGQAVELASRYDLTPIDALHTSAALTSGVDEFVTLEKPTKPMCQVAEVNVISLYQEED